VQTIASGKKQARPNQPADYPMRLLWKAVPAEEKQQPVLQPLMRSTWANGVEAESLIECSTGRALKQTDFERWTERGIETSLFPLSI